MRRFIERLAWRTPFNRQRRRIRESLRALWRPVVLGKAECQSEGALYDSFLACDRGDVHKFHHYFDIYERHFSRFRGTPVRLLEIGVSKGGSLRLWREYFGDDATIAAIDIDEACRRYDGVHGAVRIGDQTDETFLRAVHAELGPFDIVIDDGGHNPRHQLASFCVLYPLLTAQGLYLCEDTMVNYWPKRRDLGPDLTFMSVAVQIAERLTEPHYPRRNWDRFAEKPSGRPGSIETPAVVAATRGVHFYDSIVVFERGVRAEPYHELR